MAARTRAAAAYVSGGAGIPKGTSLPDGLVPGGPMDLYLISSGGFQHEQWEDLRCPMFRVANI